MPVPVPFLAVSICCGSAHQTAHKNTPSFLLLKGNQLEVFNETFKTNWLAFWAKAMHTFMAFIGLRSLPPEARGALRRKGSGPQVLPLELEAQAVRDERDEL